MQKNGNIKAKVWRGFLKKMKNIMRLNKTI